MQCLPRGHPAPPKERTNPRRPQTLYPPNYPARTIVAGRWEGEHGGGIIIGRGCPRVPSRRSKDGVGPGRECPLWAGTLLRKRLLALEVLGVGRLGRAADIWIAHLYPDRYTCRQEMNIASKPKNSSQRCVLEECILRSPHGVLYPRVYLKVSQTRGKAGKHAIPRKQRRRRIMGDASTR